jgi:hypothetical protein
MWYNPLVTWLLHSPLRGLMDGSTLLLTYTGRKSGKVYTFPISYVQHGDCIRLITRKGKPWLKSVAAGAPVILWLRGQARAGWAAAVPVCDTALMEAIQDVYRGMPREKVAPLLGQAMLVEVQLGRGPETAAERRMTTDQG